MAGGSRQCRQQQEAAADSASRKPIPCRTSLISVYPGIPSAQAFASASSARRQHQVEGRSSSRQRQLPHLPEAAGSLPALPAWLSARPLRAWVPAGRGPCPAALLWRELVLRTWCGCGCGCVRASFLQCGLFPAAWAVSCSVGRVLNTISCMLCSPACFAHLHALLTCMLCSPACFLTCMLCSPARFAYQLALLTCMRRAH
jgi:hypothetical protein